MLHSPSQPVCKVGVRVKVAVFVGVAVTVRVGVGVRVWLGTRVEVAYCEVVDLDVGVGIRTMGEGVGVRPNTGVTEGLWVVIGSIEVAVGSKNDDGV